MAQYLIKDETLTNIADAIREKTGDTNVMFPEDMPDKIYGIVTSTEELLPASKVQDYIRPEIMELINKVKSVQTDDSITFIALSDSHYPAEQSLGFYDGETIKSTIQANMATKILAYMLNLDFIAHTGDVSSGDKTTTVEMLKTQIEGFNSYFREASDTLPCFIAIGNHDAGIYYHNEMSDGNVYTLDGDYLYRNFTKYSDSDKTVFGGEQYGGYCYRDFEDKKLRVFLLNTSESIVYNQIDAATLGSQRLWLANALLDLNNKSDASEWKFMILCHYPADYGATMPLSQLLKAYVENGNITIVTENNATSTISFSGNNSAKFIAQFHGHVHNFKYDKLNVYSNGVAEEYDAWRICVPNGQYNRENYYTTVGSYKDIDFSEETSYLKTKDTANGTSFIVNVINPSEKKIYSFCYGAGIDRVIGYGATVYYSITSILSNTTISNTVSSVKEGEPFSTTITVNAGYDMSTLTVTMNGADITSGVYKDGVITIPEVTGNIVITAKAQARPNFTNLVPSSINSDGNILNSTGYQDNAYIDSSGGISSVNGYCLSGFIPVKTGIKTIRVAGDGISHLENYTRITFYDSNFDIIGAAYPGDKLGSSTYYGTVKDEDATALTWTLTSDMVNALKGVYIRVGAKGKGENLIVTVDEEITYGGSTEEVTSYTISNNLTKVTTSNAQTLVDAGSSYSATLTPEIGYLMSSVTVTMGGVDITSSAYSNGTITINKVTGNVVITAKATVEQTSDYTNQIPLSVDVDGTPYNDGVGYKTDTRINSSATEGAATGMCLTGYIPITSGATIRIKNVTFAGTHSSYLQCYNESKVANKAYSQTDLINSTVDGVTTIILDTSNSLRYMRLTCGVIDDTSIITVNEEITD
jgi:hypothetical protein